MTEDDVLDVFDDAYQYALANGMSEETYGTYLTGILHCLYYSFGEDAVDVLEDWAMENGLTVRVVPISRKALQ